MDGTLPTTLPSKSDRRSKSKSNQNSKSSLVMALISCLAWLYVAGRLWQDAENRTLLASLLKKNSEQRPKVLTVEDKLMVLGCKDLERRISEIEMELTLAKSQGYLRNQLHQSGSSSTKKLLAVIGVYTGFGSRLRRRAGCQMDGHEDAHEELPNKAKFFFSTAVQNWDAEFYVKIDDSINVDIAGSLLILTKDLAQYINVNSALFKAYAHDDTSVGSWMMGLKTTYIDDSRLCCSTSRQDKVCSLA